MAVVKAKLGKPEPVRSYPPPPVREDGTDMQFKENLFSIIDLDTLIWVRNQMWHPGESVWRCGLQVPDWRGAFRGVPVLPNHEHYGKPRSDNGREDVLEAAGWIGVYYTVKDLIYYHVELKTCSHDS